MPGESPSAHGCRSSASVVHRHAPQLRVQHGAAAIEIGAAEIAPLDVIQAVAYLVQIEPFACGSLLYDTADEKKSDRAGRRVVVHLQAHLDVIRRRLGELPESEVGRTEVTVRFDEVAEELAHAVHGFPLPVVSPRHDMPFSFASAYTRHELDNEGKDDTPLAMTAVRSYVELHIRPIM